MTRALNTIAPNETSCYQGSEALAREILVERCVFIDAIGPKFGSAAGLTAAVVHS